MLIKWRCTVNHVRYCGEEWNLDLDSAHGKREINNGPETKSLLCWTENDKAKCVPENVRKQKIVMTKKTLLSLPCVLAFQLLCLTKKQDHCQKWLRENRICSANSSRSQSSSKKSKKRLKQGRKVKVGIGRNGCSIKRRVLFAGFCSLCGSACCFISSKITCLGLTLSTVS